MLATPFPFPVLKMPTPYTCVSLPSLCHALFGWAPAAWYPTVYLPIYLSTYLPTYPPTYLPAYSPAYSPVCLPTCLPISSSLTCPLLLLPISPLPTSIPNPSPPRHLLGRSSRRYLVSMRNRCGCMVTRATLLANPTCADQARCGLEGQALRDLVDRNAADPVPLSNQDSEPESRSFSRIRHDGECRGGGCRVGLPCPDRG